MGGRDQRAGVATLKVRFEEVRRPTLISTSRREDVPGRGVFWIEPDRGTIVATRLELSPPGLGPVVIETTYRADTHLVGWLPVEMRESYGHRTRTAEDDRVEAVARYAGWRRAHVVIDVVVPVTR